MADAVVAAKSDYDIKKQEKLDAIKEEKLAAEAYRLKKERKIKEEAAMARKADEEEAAAKADAIAKRKREVGATPSFGRSRAKKLGGKAPGA